MGVFIVEEVICVVDQLIFFFLFSDWHFWGLEGLLRCGKSCRLRWINYLRADLKRGNISAEEENTIVKLHASFGNRLVPKAY